MNLGSVAKIRQGMGLSGSGVGAKSGDWCLSLIESSDIVDDQVSLSDLRGVAVQRNTRTATHLLQPYDILVTARAQNVSVALIPPRIAETVAGPTLIVVRVPDPGTGLAHFLWYYLSSTIGRTRIADRLTLSSLPTLSVRALRDLPVPRTPKRGLSRLADLVDAAEESRAAARAAVRLRHAGVRDALIQEIATEMAT